MKRRKWTWVLLLIVCAVAFFGYRIWKGKVSDTIPPVISISQDEQLLEVSAYAPREVLLQGVTARDDRDGDVTETLVVEKIDQIREDGTVTVTYAAFDRSGNVTKIQRQVRYTDYVGPRFTLSRSLIFVYPNNFDVMDFVGAEDALDGDISHRVKATSVDGTAVTTEGVHMVRFRVTNSLGDTRELQIPVEVCTSGKYTGNLSLTEYLIYLPRGAEFNARDYLDTYLLYGKTTDLKVGMDENMELKTTGVVNTEEPGTYPVSYYVSVTQGSAVYTGYAKLIVVVEG